MYYVLMYAQWKFALVSSVALLPLPHPIVDSTSNQYYELIAMLGLIFSPTQASVPTNSLADLQRRPSHSYTGKGLRLPLVQKITNIYIGGGPCFSSSTRGPIILQRYTSVDS